MPRTVHHNEGGPWSDTRLCARANEDAGRRRLRGRRVGMNSGSRATPGSASARAGARVADHGDPRSPRGSARPAGPVAAVATARAAGARERALRLVAVATTSPHTWSRFSSSIAPTMCSSRDARHPRPHSRPRDTPRDSSCAVIDSRIDRAPSCSSSSGERRHARRHRFAGSRRCHRSRAARSRRST